MGREVIEALITQLPGLYVAMMLGAEFCGRRLAWRQYTPFKGMFDREECRQLHMTGFQHLTRYPGW